MAKIRDEGRFLGIETEMEAQSAGAKNGFTQVTHEVAGGQRNQAEQLSEWGEGRDMAHRDTEEARPTKRPIFPPLARDGFLSGKEENKENSENWMKIFTPIVERLALQMRFNLKSRNVEIRTCKETKDVSLWQYPSCG
uniref:Uncharacterized protein n=1 Tax=Felis catus TaxID=9685 RepID=A0ABI7ZAB0_FELCA